MSRFPPVACELPEWVDELSAEPRVYPDVHSQAAFVVALSRRNMEEDTGGPFGAAVFDLDTGELIAPGVNLVVPSSMAIAHAEMVAVAIAGRITGSYHLGAGGRRRVLVSSTEPCAMCFGAVHWSGVRRLVCCARDEDARAVGFDEGPKLEDWRGALAERGIEVVQDVERSEAAAVLEDYAAGGGPIYNGRTEHPGA